MHSAAQNPNSSDAKKPRACKRVDQGIDATAVYRVPESCEKLKISRSKFYSLVAAGVIRPIPHLDGRVSGAELIRVITCGSKRRAAR